MIRYVNKIGQKSKILNPKDIVTYMVVNQEVIGSDNQKQMSVSPIEVQDELEKRLELTEEQKMNGQFK